MSIPVCPTIDAATKLGSIPQYSTELAPCTAQQIGKPVFFGRRADKDEPLFVALDFEQYEIARKGMMIATTTAIVLGVSLVFAVVMKKKSRAVFGY